MNKKILKLIPLNKKLIITAWKLASRISPNPQKLNYVFDKSFFNYLPRKKLIDLLKNIHNENGNVVEISTVTVENPYNASLFLKLTEIL